VRHTDLEAFAHQSIPVERVIEILNPSRSAGHYPLFQVLLVLQNNEEARLTLPGLDATHIAAGQQAAKFELSFYFGEQRLPDGGPERLAATLEYACDLFDRATVQSLTERLERLLTAIAKDADVPVSQIDLLSPAERQCLLHEWNRTDQLAAPSLFPTLFEEQAERTPEAIAVVCGDSVLTYRQLNADANRVADRLISKGIGPEQRVAVALPRSTDMLTAVLAILKSGAAYLPLSPAYPIDRLAYMVDDAQPVLAITCEEMANRLPQTLPQLRLDLRAADSSDDQPSAAHSNDRRRMQALHPEHPAYVLYTSGSTGRPKAVVVPHRALGNYLAWAMSAYPLQQGCGAAVNTSLSFDLTVTTLLLPLLAGKSVRLLPEGAELEDLPALATRPEPFSLLSLVPAHLDFILHALPPEQCAGLTQCLILGGEALNPAAVERWVQSSPDVPVINEYGPTETTVGCIFHAVEAADLQRSSIPIGKPIWNTRAYVLDAFLQPVPANVAGELYIAGQGVARGYLHNSPLTSERFVADPFGAPGDRLYRTGDRVRWLPDGSLDYLGRIDRQIKIRGFRIEPGEIESALTRHPAVIQAAVVDRVDNAGMPQLVAYVVPGNVRPDGMVLRQFLAEQLPDYMMPAAFVILEQLPLTPNGKLDRKALPAPEGPALANPDFEPPLGELEVTLAKVWAELLGIPRIGRHDHFFDLGGHSLSAIRVVARLRDELHREVALHDLFAHPVIKELADHLAAVTVPQEANDACDLAAEAVLDPAIRASTPFQWQSSPKEILLTGAAGFLGAFLLSDLLDTTDARIHCLIRCASLEQGQRRLIESMTSYGLLGGRLPERVTVIQGDLSKPQFGLPASRFDALGNIIDAIYHNGAWVNNLHSYQTLKAANVLGTQEILRLASTARPKAIHYISTLDVLAPVVTAEPGRVLSEDQLLENWRGLKQGYAQSKWVAEQLLRVGAERGIPSTIYRLPYIFGSSVLGASNPNGQIELLIDACLTLGCWPDIDDSFNLLPVDYLSRCITTLSRSPNILGQSLNFMHTNRTALAEIFARLPDRAGSKMKKVSMQDWTRRCIANPATAPVAEMFDLPAAMRASQGPTTPPSYRVQIASAIADYHGDVLPCPPISDALVEKVIGWRQRRILARRRIRSDMTT
jgi:amino acid adenylation domain-containing protein/thioester reductase-like protein